ncbi:MAG: NADP-dependent oxidoreductase, partial [Pauljensenia sp.]
MRALTYSRYGEPHVLSLSDVPVPKLGPGSVLIKVHRAAVNPVDWELMAGGLDKLLDVVFPVIPGWDVSGEIAALGPDVPEFEVGERVASYARKDFVSGGTFAEYVAVPATSVAHVPDGLGFDEAAALPLAGLTALRCVETLGITEEDTVLVHAASGGVGYIASQLASATGATVIGTASPRHHDKLRAVGVTPVAHGDGLTERIH